MLARRGFCPEIVGSIPTPATNKIGCFIKICLDIPIFLCYILHMMKLKLILLVLAVSVLASCKTVTKSCMICPRCMTENVARLESHKDVIKVDEPNLRHIEVMRSTYKCQRCRFKWYGSETLMIVDERK